MRRSFLPLFLLFLLSATSLNAAITGVLIRDDGTPLAGAAVRAFVRQPSDAAVARLLSEKPDPEPIAVAKSADDGKFSLDVKGAAAVGVVIDVAGAPAAAFFAADGENAGAILVPINPRRTTVTADGKPVPNAIVNLGDFAVQRTDANGAFALLIPNRVLVIAPNFAPATLQRGDTIALTRGITVRGKVLGADGQPAPGATLSIADVPLAKSASDGTFTIAHAPDRWTTIEATSASAAGLAINRGGDVVVRLHPAASVRGSVSGPSGPVAGAAVSIAMRGEAVLPKIVLTDSHGGFAVASLVPGVRQIAATHPLFSMATSHELAVTGATTVSLRLAARGRVAGHVIDEQQKPVAGAIVIDDGPSRSGAITDAAGGFWLPVETRANLMLRLIAWKSGYAPSMRNASLKNDLVLKLMRGFPLQLKVVDAGGVPIADARVAIHTTSDLIGSALPCSIGDTTPCRTGADGAIAMRIPEGHYAIGVTGESVAPRTIADQLLNAAKSPLTITVDRGATLSGHVTFEDGSPVAGARVFSRRMPLTTTTDAKGAFTLNGLARTAVQLSVETDDKPPMESAPVIATPPANNVSIVLPMPARIEGRVIDRVTGQPLTAFSISLQQRGAPFSGAMPATFTSDDGSFVLDRVLPGTVTLHATAPGYVAGTIGDLTVTAGKTTSGIEMKLDRGMKVTGRVTAAGEPVAGVSVTVPGSPMGRFPSGAVQTNDQGEFSVDGVAAGEQMFTFTKEGFVRKQKSVEVAAGKDARLDVELEKGLELHGRVTDRAGQPVAGVNVQVGATATRFVTSAMTDDDGAFSVAGLEPGVRYAVHTRKSGFVVASVENIDPATQPQVNVTLDRGATLNGHVTGLTPGDLGAIRVIAYGNGSQAEAMADPSGAFTLSGIADGRVTVTALLEGARPRNAQPKVVDVVNGSAPDVEINFADGITIRGRITRNGAPVANGRVMFIPVDHTQHQGNSMIAADGTYEVTGVSNGDYQVRIFADNSADLRPYTVSGNGTFDVDLQGGAIRGRVVDAQTGEPLANALVSIGFSAQQQLLRRASTDSDGRFVLDAVPDGTYKVNVTHEQYVAASDEVTVSGGTSNPMELKLAGGQEQVFRFVDADTGAPLDGSLTVMRDNKPVPITMRPTGDGGAKVWLANGAYVVRPIVRGYLPQTASFSVPGPEVKIGLSRGGIVVLRSSGGGEFRLVMAGQTANPRMVRLPPNGSAQLDALPPGVWSVEKIDVDGVTVVKRYDVTVAAGQTQTVNVE